MRPFLFGAKGGSFMGKMCKAFGIGMSVVVLAWIILLVGCDKFKGDKGDKGDKGSSGLIGTKTYTGTPTSNPYSVSCPEITDLSKQVVNVYSTFGGEIIPLPITGTIEVHMYEFYPTVATIVLASWYTDTVPVTLPATALKSSNGLQASYRIDIKTFSSAPAKSAYLQARANKLDKTGYEELILGK